MSSIFQIWLIYLLCVICGIYSFLHAQTVSNVTATQVGKTIHVSYDLDKAADITLHLSTDGGKTYGELHQVSGDVGVNVISGHKTIVWDVLVEQERLEGDDIVFKVKARNDIGYGIGYRGIINNIDATVNEEGQVCVEVHVAADGHVLDARVINNSKHKTTITDSKIQQQCIERAKQALYKPGREELRIIIFS